MKRDSAIELAAVSAAFLGAIALIQPRGDFPLNDDGFYALPTFELARTGHFHMTAVPASLRAQVVWGALFVRLFGASYHSLRIATVVSALIAIAAVHALLRMTALPRAARVIATLAFAFHPIFLWSSCTFMTETHFVCASALALYCYARGIRDERPGFLLLGCAFVAVSWWIRQTGVLTAIPPIALLVFLRRKRDAAICAIAPVAYVVIGRFWPETLTSSKAVLGTFVDMWRDPVFHFEDAIALIYRHTFLPIQQTALWFLPVVAATLTRKLRKRDAAVAVLFAIGFILSIRERLPMPYYGRRGWENVAGDIFMNFGLGPPTLSDVFSGSASYPFTLAYSARVMLTLVATLAAIALVSALFRAWRREVVFLLCAGYAAAHIAGLWVSAVYFDRYSLDSAWPLVIGAAIVAPWHRAARFAAVALIACLAVFGILAVNEYFAWQRARWTAYDELRRGGVEATNIDGGMEAEFTYLRPYVTDREYARSMRGSPPVRYAITFHERSGFRVIARHPFRGWLGLHRADVLTLQRISGTSG